MTSFPEEPIFPADPPTEEPEPILPENKTMVDRQKEVRAWTVEKGWRENGVDERTMGEEVALLHTEVAEATEAYRLHMLDRWIVTYPGDGSERVITILDSESFDYGDNKPEGVASEVIDTLIRLLDNYAQYGLGAPEIEPDRTGSNPYENWGDAASALHHKIARVWALRKQYAYLYESNAWTSILSEAYWDIMNEIISVCHHFDINIVEEYEAKMKYNQTRSYRHDGKNL